MYASYNDFCRLENAGRREEANRAAQQVVIDYNNAPDPDFIVSLCALAGRRNNRINHHLWSGIVFPYVAAKFNSSSLAVKCLVYSDKSAHAKLGWITEQQLVDVYRKMCPSDEWARNRKEELLSEWLAYTIHEWPSGVLYGNDGATIEQCREILDAVEELRSIDDNSAYATLCSDVEKKTLEYREWLAKRLTH